jgi:disease resistance protein RPS2
MAAKIMYEAKTKTSMFEAVVWATVSQPQDLKKLQQKIAEGVDLDLNMENEQIRVAKLHERLKSLKSFLIILDDVWEKLDLIKLGIPSQSTTEKRKLIVTSRVHDALPLTNGHSKILRMDVLTEDEAWSLFREKADLSVDAAHLLAKEVAKECKGLPLALEVVGSALRGKNEHIWKDALRQLQRNIPGMSQRVYVQLKWSYDQLQDKEAQNIFLLCCLFPEDYEIEVETLVRYGWGLGIFSGIRNLSEARDRVYALVETLKSCSLLSHAEDECVKMHDLIRHMAIEIACKVFMVNDDGKEWPSKESYANYTHISVTLSGNFALPESIDCPKLEFLRMVLKRNTKVKMLENTFDDMRGLRVLELSRFESLASSMFGLTNLRALHLKWCQLETTSHISKLENLEILNLGYSDFKELPKEVGQLKKLKLLDLSGCSRLGEIAPGIIPGLVNLEELLMSYSFREWEAEEDGKERKKASLAEVASLRKLVALEIDIQNPKLVSELQLETQKLERYFLRMEDTFLFKPSSKKAIRLKSEEALPSFGLSITRNAEYLELEGDGCIRIINDLVSVRYPEVKELIILFYFI